MRIGAGKPGLPANDVDTTGGSPVEVPQGVILAPDEGLMPSSPTPVSGDLLDDSMPSIRQTPPEALGDTYGPFDTLYTVTDPGGAVTRTTHDAFGHEGYFVGLEDDGR